MNKPYVLQAFMDTPWAILPSKLAILEEIVIRHANGEKLDAEEVQNRIHGAMRPPEKTVKKVAVLPLFGSIFPRANMMTEMSGATSTEMFGKRFDALMDNPEIDAIVLDVNSPGGQVGGVLELSDKIYQARGRKPIVAVANHMMASAAYWIGTAADKVYVSPSADVGSIGVFAVHQDVSKALENEGIKVSIIKAGKYKAEGNPYQPLTEEAAANIQGSVDEVYDKFVNAVARNRGISADEVKSRFGEGRVVSADQALALGMADEIATLEDVIAKLFTKNNGGNPRSAEADANLIQEDQPAAISTEDGQEPVEVSVDNAAQARRVMAEALAAENKKVFGETMSDNIRKLMAERADKVRAAQALLDVTEEEDRELTEAEQAEFDAALADAEALSKKIETRQELRQRLETQAAKVGNESAEAEKPQASNDLKTMKRADFEALAPLDRAAFVKAGGKIEE